jgi:glycosyltransferase involved in cell wall biosynthesis
VNRKIVLFIADFGPGGAERVFANLAGLLAERGCDVTLLVGVLGEATYLKNLSPRVRVRELGARHMKFALPAMIRFLRRERPAAVISALEHSNLLAVLAARTAGTGTPVVATIHQTFSEALAATTGLWKRLVTRVHLRFMRFADEIVAVSYGAADDFSKLARIPRERIKVIYNPVFGPAVYQAAAEPLDHPWLQPGQPPVVLGMGRLTAQKDFPNLLRAFALARKQRDARLMILGEGDERRALEQLARSLGIENDLAMPGVVANPYVLLRHAALFVLSSAWEALPTVLVEALVCGCPVVSTDCLTGPREILQDGRLGRLVPVRNETALAEAILAGLRGECPNRVAASDLAPFSFEVAADAYFRLVSGLIEKKSHFVEG